MGDWEKKWRMYLAEDAVRSLAALPPPIKLPDNRWDYSAILSPVARESGYKLILTYSGSNIKGHLYAPPLPDKPSGKNIGFIDAVVKGNSLSVADVKITDASQRNMKFGVAMYEAVYAYAFNKLNIKKVVGGEHSSSAKRVHNNLDRIYGFKKSGGELLPGKLPGNSEYDNAYGDYSYILH